MAAMNPHRPRDMTATLQAIKAAGAILVVILEVM